ncbi:hypothetical protein [Chitinophaga rhizophila]|uniref:Uncharacterized protein n=1 Tax=Chitinophaga rhizophila TaxID=2866212 RepID=A0ABS7GK99_9BACT|nr:hypothetical protein [Chitinophaga rhizophila]MBW8688152.1 hypothetical protein [Chitinophaga rhizophila]
MKKARLLLTALIILTLTAGFLSFKASRFTSMPAWRYTNMIVSNGIPYYTTSMFCTSHDASYFFTSWSPYFSNTYFQTGDPGGSLYLTSPNGWYITLRSQPCTVWATYLTTAF